VAELRPNEISLLLDLQERVARLERSDRRQTWDVRDGSGTLQTRVGLQAGGGYGVALPDGAAASPGLTFAQDPDTGVRRSAANELRLVAGGADKAIVGGAGDITIPGVGTVVGSVPKAPVEYPNFTDIFGYTQTLLTGKLASSGFNLLELYPIGLWFGGGATFTDCGIERENGANALKLWGGNLGAARMRIHDQVSVWGVNIPLGVLPNGYAQATAVQSGITTIADLTGLSVTVSVPTSGRRLRITGYARVTRTVADGYTTLYIREGSTNLNFALNLNILDGMLLAQAIIQPSSGSHTYKLSLERTTGAAGTTVGTNPQATNPAFILVEDIGT
jgi:hypothetical protein